MGWTIRAAEEVDIPALLRADWGAFGGKPTEAQIDVHRAFLEVDRLWVAEDGDRIVGSAGSLSLQLTVPGPASVPNAGVTVVGVLPTHRRQGILTALMARVAEDARRRREPVASLLAAESTIYRRFGYGAAVLASAVELERTYAQLRRPPDIIGRVRLLDDDELKTVLPPIHDRYRRQQPGEVSRSAGWWARSLEDPPERRGGAGPRFAAVWEDGDGYVLYRSTQNWDDGLPGFVLTVENLVAVSPEARAGLWQYCFGIDLVRTIKAFLPLDDPLRWMLVDPRRLRTTTVTDFLWVSPLDTEAALSARSYASDAALVIDVAGDARYRLAGGVCRRTDDLPDLTMAPPDLGAAYLGGVRFASLAGAGLVVEHTPGAVSRADALFATTPGPVSTTGF